MLINQLYYLLKPLIPRKLQIRARRKMIQRKRSLYTDIWPIDQNAVKPPKGWSGWPESKKFALVITHDVDTSSGQERCLELMNIENELGFKSSFNFVPERYRVSQELRNRLTKNGFEVGVHGLNHDGKLYKSKMEFQRRAAKINQYLREWGSVGFRSPAMHHNLDWLHELEIEYDASTFDTDPFEPQSDAAQTIFPYIVANGSNSKGYVELPYTLAQDFTLFILMKERNIDIWKLKLDWTVKNGGMALLNIHPDYINMDCKKLGLEEYPISYYIEFLKYIKTKYKDNYWHVLPKDMAYFWSTNFQAIKER